MKFIINFCFLFFLSVATFAQTASLSGSTLTFDDRPICHVNVTLFDNNGQMIDSTFTDQNGTYVFNNLPIGQQYRVALSKGFDILEGVSIRDIVFLRLFALGIRNFDSNLQILAADVGGAENAVTTFDMVLIQKALLGSNNTFNLSKGWIFINVQSLPIIRGEAIEDKRDVLLINDVSDFNFVGIKMGDLDNSAEPCR